MRLYDNRKNAITHENVNIIEPFSIHIERSFQNFTKHFRGRVTNITTNIIIRNIKICIKNIMEFLLSQDPFTALFYPFARVSDFVFVRSFISQPMENTLILLTTKENNTTCDKSLFAS